MLDLPAGVILECPRDNYSRDGRSAFVARLRLGPRAEPSALHAAVELLGAHYHVSSVEVVADHARPSILVIGFRRLEGIDPPYTSQVRAWAPRTGRPQNTPRVWTREALERLREAYRSGGRQKVLDAFPGHTLSAIDSALRAHHIRKPRPPRLTILQQQLLEIYAAQGKEACLSLFPNKLNRRLRLTRALKRLERRGLIQQPA